MGIARRIVLTATAGALLGLATVIVEDPGFPTAGINAAIDLPVGILAAILILATPLIVGRWWVVCSMAGPALALAIMQVANVSVSLDDGTGPAINYRTIFQFLGILMVMSVVYGARSLFAARQSDQPG